MASVEKRDRKWLVRWRDPDGTQRARRCPDKATADALKRDVERAFSLGHAWEPADGGTLPVLVEVDDGRVTGGMFADYLDSRRAWLAAGTRRHYDRAMLRFARFLAERNPRKRRLTVDMMTRDAVEQWFGTLVDDHGGNLDVSTARLYVTAVQSAWAWGYDSDDYGEHVSRPRRLEMPTPTRTPAVAPTWAEMDAAIAAGYRLATEARNEKIARSYIWRSRLCTILRFTGLRVDEQAMQLRWEDLDLDRGELVLRGELGKSRRERGGRIVPLAPALVELLAGWGQREGFMIAPWKRARVSHASNIVEMWRAAEVRERVYLATDGRGRGQAHHAFRKGLKSGLSQLGVAREVRDYLVGHHQGIDGIYLDVLDQAREAVKKIPPLSDSAAAGEVIHLPLIRRTTR